MRSLAIRPLVFSVAAGLVTAASGCSVQPLDPGGPGAAGDAGQVDITMDLRRSHDGGDAPGPVDLAVRDLAIDGPRGPLDLAASDLAGSDLAAPDLAIADADPCGGPVTCDLPGYPAPFFEVRGAGGVLCNAQVVLRQGGHTFVLPQACRTNVGFGDARFQPQAAYEITVSAPGYATRTLSPPPVRPIPCSCHLENDLITIELQPSP